MQKSLMTQVRDGRAYIKVWPLRKELTALFVENRVIRATELSFKVMPGLALCCMSVQLNWFGVQYIPQALASALLFLSLPLQGFLWLGKRATTPLSPRMTAWYRELEQKMTERGYEGNVCRAKPCYMDLAVLLKDIYEKMDASFRRDCF